MRGPAAISTIGIAKLLLALATALLLAGGAERAFSQTEDDVEWAKRQSAVICNGIYENEQFLKKFMEDIKHQMAAEDLRSKTRVAELRAQNPVPHDELKKESELHHHNMNEIYERRDQGRREYEDEKRLINAQLEKFYAEIQYRARIAPADQRPRNFYNGVERS